MTRTVALIAVGVLLAFALPTPVPAHTLACGKRAEILKQLRDRFGESRSWYGVGRGGSLVELWTDPRTGRWSLIYTRPDGAMTCGLAFGVGSSRPAARAPGTDS